MQTKKSSFILYTSFYDAIKHLSDAELGTLHRAVYTFHLTGDIPKLPTELNMAFSFFKSQFERDDVKYQKVVQRNKSNIAKRWGNKNTKNTNGKSGIPLIPLATTLTKHTDDDDDNDDDKENDYQEVGLSLRHSREETPSCKSDQPGDDLNNPFGDVA